MIDVWMIVLFRMAAFGGYVLVAYTPLVAAIYVIWRNVDVWEGVDVIGVCCWLTPSLVWWVGWSIFYEYYKDAPFEVSIPIRVGQGGVFMLLGVLLVGAMVWAGYEVCRNAGIRVVRRGD